MADDLTARVTTVAAVAAEVTRSTPLAAEAGSIGDALVGPLRVAFAGRVKAGKSTLLNALVGQRLAPTDAGECTRLVTVYREAPTYTVTAHLGGGGHLPLSFRRGAALEVDLGEHRPETIDHLDVGWPSSSLRRFTLIDTPGLGSLSADLSARTHDFLEAAPPDVVVYLLRHVHPQDVAFFDAFGQGASLGGSSFNAIGVLSRADELGGGRLDALAVARRIADRYGTDRRIRAWCGTVVPVAGLLAETATTLTEAEVGALRDVAALPSSLLSDLLLSADLFRELDVPSIPPEQRRSLVTRLGMFGLRFAVAGLASGQVRNAPELAEALVAESGLPALRRVLEQQTARASVLRARSTLLRLHRLSRAIRVHDPSGADRVELEVERLTASAIELEELRLSELLDADALALTDEEVAEIRVMAAAAAQTTGRSAVAEGVSRWRRRAADPLLDPLTAGACETVARLYEARYVSAG